MNEEESLSEQQSQEQCNTNTSYKGDSNDEGYDNVHHKEIVMDEEEPAQVEDVKKCRNASEPTPYLDIEEQEEEENKK